MANRIRCDACGSSDLKLVHALGRVLPTEGAGVKQMRFFCRTCETHSYWVREA